MNPYPKPRPIVFMLAGHELRDTLAILDKWQSMTAVEVDALGLGLKRISNVSERLEDR
jgi:hypothetical protein